MNRRVKCYILGAGLLSCTLTGAVGAHAQEEPLSASGYPYPASEAVAGKATGKWTGGASMGVLGSTPDGTALATNANADYFVTDRISVGPLLQVGFTNDLTQVGLSGQGKYWITSPASGNRGQLYLQSGLGFVHADFLRDDTSWLVPLGVGLDYAITPAVSVTSAFLINFTNLHTGAGTSADVMPGFAFGLRF